MARKTYTYNNINYDSQEEIEFVQWLEEAQDLGLVKKWEYQPESFKLSDRVTTFESVQLKTKTKQVERSLLQKHIYTSDFKIWFTEDVSKLDIPFKNLKYLKNKIVYVDIKGEYNSYGSNSGFSVNAKWVWDKYSILVEQVKVEQFFKKTWVPVEVRLTPKLREVRKKYKDCKTIKDILEEMADATI